MKVRWRTCLKIGLSAFILYLCMTYWPNIAGLIGTVATAAMPLLIGCVIAYPVNILMSFYERHFFPKSKKNIVDKMRRPVCMTLAFLTMIAIVALVVVLIVPQLIDCVQLLLAELPAAIDYVIDGASQLHLLPEDILAWLEGIDWKTRINEVIQLLLSGVGDLMGTVVEMVGSVISGVVTGFMSLIFSIYLLMGRDTLCRQGTMMLKKALHPKWFDQVMHVLRTVNDSFHKYIVGQCMEAVILGVLCALGMMILQLPYASMIGALVAFTALIPVAGAYIGAGVGVFMILTVSPVKALIFLIFILVLQQVEGNVIYPRVVGSSLGLPGIWVLAAVTIGGGVMGVTGMLLGVPLAAATYRLLQERMHEEKRETESPKMCEATKE